MASGFAPEFLILIGVDIFLGASILAVLLDRHFPTTLPYVLDGAALIGFGELLTGPSFVSGISIELQFYYSFAYAMISVLTLFALNLYLLFLRRRPFESAVLGVFATIPSALGTLYFTSAFVNGLTVSLPLVPVIPIEGVYAMFGISVGLVVLSLVVFGRRLGKDEAESARPSPRMEEPMPARFHEEPPVVPTQGPQPAGGTGVVYEDNQPTTVQLRNSVEMTPEPSTRDLVTDSASSFPGSGNEFSTEPSDPQEGSSVVQTFEAPPDQGPPVPSPGLAASARTGSDPAIRSEKVDYVKRLRDSIGFFEKAVTQPVRINPATLKGVFKDVRRAYLTPAAIVLVEDSSGATVSRSLLEMSTDEALRVMADAMKTLHDRGVGKV